MRWIDPILLATARELVDFGGGAMTDALAEEQLRGAVAVHNILAREGFAYLADEVGMGKTYVALGVVGLLRFFHPDIRVLYITPRENIQSKWIKELMNFTRHNWQWSDQKVRSVQGLPCVDVAICQNLADWARQSIRNRNRDFIVRMTSFSFPLAKDARAWRKKRKQLVRLAHLPDNTSFDLRDKETFKRSYARTINTLLPHYDLVVVDEAHNFKHGRQSQATRNQLVRLLLGLAKEEGSEVPGYGQRMDRVLLLSATPLEGDYAELWRQLDLFGFGDSIRELCDSEVDAESKKDVASRFLVRRLTGLEIAGTLHTKNMYRREWRGGGCRAHDDPLEVPSDRQSLIVALVQKKVSEVLQSEKFGASFQMGMLASFESFYQTAKVATDEGRSNFDDADQSQSVDEKEGIDTSAINQIAASYRRAFGEALPHPKMDAIVDALAPSFETGEKTLVFVRRVKSVDELSDKLCRRYDEWLQNELKEKLPETLLPELERVWAEYEADRRERARRAEALEVPSDEALDGDAERLLVSEESMEDPGGNDTFFAWFFRGEGPKGYLSGAAFRDNRLQGAGSAYSTLLEDNYIASLLGEFRHPFETLAGVLGISEEACGKSLRELAYTTYELSERQKTYPRLHVYRAYQAAGLVLLSKSEHPRAAHAKVILRERYPACARQAELEAPSAFPAARDFVNTRTVFTELRLRPNLASALWPEHTVGTFVERFRNQECRRELLAATMRLGYAFVDLWALMVGRLGSLSLGAQERTEERAESLVEDFLNLLESQTTETGFHAYRELSEIGKHHDLILAVNFPDASQKRLFELPRLFGHALSRQNPVGGMFGGVNRTLVGQFRMPGYPVILITTEVLQEGEDLHPFCSRIIHYGITWTPSGMEQRTGRVDRIGSLTHRKLDCLPQEPDPEELLQVYYPHLGDTVERLQIERVFERMNRFLRLIHRMGAYNGDDSRINTRVEFVRERRDIDQIRGRLESEFDVRESDLEGTKILMDRPDAQVEEMKAHLAQMETALAERVRVEWDEHDEEAALYGTVFVKGSRLLRPGDKRQPGRDGVRMQPFVLFLRSVGPHRTVVLHCISPVGDLGHNYDPVDTEDLHAELKGAKLCEVNSNDADTYTLTAESDILFHTEMTQPEEVLDLLTRVTVAADRAERELLRGADAPMKVFRKDLHRELRHAPD